MMELMLRSWDAAVGRLIGHWRSPPIDGLAFHALIADRLSPPTPPSRAAPRSSCPGICAVFSGLRLRRNIR
jgi:hypothetical protein